MELVIKPFQALPCELEKFTINGKDAKSMDFGDTYDHCEEDAGPYGCRDMYFEPKPPRYEVLHKYGITVVEYFYICNQLVIELCVGSCGLCRDEYSSIMNS